MINGKQYLVVAVSGVDGAQLDRVRIALDDGAATDA
jgi:hypothetical protein